MAAHGDTPGVTVQPPGAPGGPANGEGEPESPFPNLLRSMAAVEAARRCGSKIDSLVEQRAAPGAQEAGAASADVDSTIQKLKRLQAALLSDVPAAFLGSPEAGVSQDQPLVFRSDLQGAETRLASVLRESEARAKMLEAKLTLAMREELNASNVRLVTAVGATAKQREDIVVRRVESLARDQAAAKRALDQLAQDSKACIRAPQLEEALGKLWADLKVSIGTLVGAAASELGLVARKDLSEALQPATEAMKKEVEGRLTDSRKVLASSCVFLETKVGEVEKSLDDRLKAVEGAALTGEKIDEHVGGEDFLRRLAGRMQPDVEATVLRMQPDLSGFNARLDAMQQEIGELRSALERSNAENARLRGLVEDLERSAPRKRASMQPHEQLREMRGQFEGLMRAFADKFAGEPPADAAEPPTPSKAPSPFPVSFGARRVSSTRSVGHSEAGTPGEGHVSKKRKVEVESEDVPVAGPVQLDRSSADADERSGEFMDAVEGSDGSASMDEDEDEDGEEGELNGDAASVKSEHTAPTVVSLGGHDYAQGAPEPDDHAFKCSECAASFRSRHALASHHVKHMPKNFACGQCDSRFTTQGRLSAHELKHNGPVLSCRHPGCNFTTRVAAGLASHKRKHPAMAATEQ